MKTSALQQPPSGGSDHRLVLPLTKSQKEALKHFHPTEWRKCHWSIHIKTLMALINRKEIEWQNRLPYIGPEFHQWKINCEFRLRQNAEASHGDGSATPTPEKS